MPISIFTCGPGPLGDVSCGVIPYASIVWRMLPNGVGGFYPEAFCPHHYNLHGGPPNYVVWKILLRRCLKGEDVFFSPFPLSLT